MNILVLDVGTSSMRGVLLTHDGTELLQSQRTYCPSYLENGWVEQSPLDWKNALFEIVKEVSSTARKKKSVIKAIAITAQRSSVIPMDATMTPLHRAIMWQDRRTEPICAELEPYNDKIFALSGAKVSPVFSGSKMTWLRENCQEIYEKTFKLLIIPDYLIYLLTGELCTDHTYGSRSHLMNLRTRMWDDELLGLFRVEKDRLCPLVEPGSVCGYVTKEFANATGCPAHIPVITAGGDQQCSAIGQGVVRGGVLSVTAGTGGFLTAAIGEVPKSLKSDVICNCSSIPGEYILEYNLLTCCSAFDWFRREFYPEGPSFDALEAEVDASPVGAGGVLCLPYFQGRGTPDYNPLATGHFANVTLNTRRRDLLRSLLEGICFEIGNGIDVMRSYMNVTDIIINGGLTDNRAFNEIQANVYDAMLIRRGKSDATARGALMVAATALGQYSSIEEAFRCIDGAATEYRFTPKEPDVSVYRELRQKMNAIYQSLYASNG